LVPAVGRPLVVELGPGGGVITDEIHNRLPAGGKLVAVEVNQDMVHHLKRSRPWLQVVHGDATQLSDLMKDAGLHRADAVISALPWTLFSEQQQERILDEISKVLTPQGIFATVTTLTALPFPAARRFRRHLSETFEQVKISRPVWRNVPPALLYICRQPIGQG
jgi:phospholipid N-methyltransferase